MTSTIPSRVEAGMSEAIFEAAKASEAASARTTTRTNRCIIGTNLRLFKSRWQPKQSPFKMLGIQENEARMRHLALDKLSCHETVCLSEVLERIELWYYADIRLGTH